jgi:hypothetical protein
MNPVGSGIVTVTAFAASISTLLGGVVMSMATKDSLDGDLAFSMVIYIFNKYINI